MNNREFFDTLDRLQAQDMGCPDAGTHNESLRLMAMQELVHRKNAKKDLLVFIVERRSPDKGYTIEDADEFIGWLEDWMDFYI